ncbi:MAG TPA: N-methyl-L-tryptophan oxidase [Patescibacteria group bacterium]|nr:N-methyl-L-tryptophan oxidase [Patescibacteria group bacterium]
MYDIVVAGLGAMGSAAAYHAAARGARVIGFDRFHPPHEFGSSHGLTRIIREAYFEHPSYVPLVQRAYQLWADLQEATKRQLLLETGGVMIGKPKGLLVSGARRSAEEHGLRHKILSGTELRQRFPVFEPAAEMAAIWEPRAGVLFPESAIEAHLGLAGKLGASLRFNEPVLRWEPDGAGVRVRTALGTYRAAKLLITAGAWVSSLLAELKLPLAIERQVLYWFEPLSGSSGFQPQNCPIYIWEYSAGEFFYGFPDLGEGVKVALHHQGEPAQPESVRRDVSAQEIEQMRALLRRFMPAAEGRLITTAVCVYANTPDEHFLLDHHPLHKQVVVASPCSGHGFKFSSAIGEVASMLLRDEQPSFDLSLFRIGRLLRD